MFLVFNSPIGVLQRCVQPCPHIGHDLLHRAPDLVEYALLLLVLLVRLGRQTRYQLVRFPSVKERSFLVVSDRLVVFTLKSESGSI